MKEATTTVTTESPYGTAPKFDQSLIEQVRRSIEEHGIQLIAVYDTADEEYKPFIYTIGLRLRGRPELIAFGDDEAHLNAIGEILYRIARDAKPFDPSEPLPGSGGSLLLAAPDREFDAFLQAHCLIEAREFYGCDRVEALVVVPESELPEPAPTLH
jgi:hypothetical protein